MQQLTIFDVLDAEPVAIDIHTFGIKLAEMVATAIKFLGHEEILGESTEIAVSDLVTSRTNKYFPTDCAMIRVYLMSSKGTGNLMLVNRHALNYQLDWVESRHYDHRYFKTYNHSCAPNSYHALPHITSLAAYRELHFKEQVNGIWFLSDTVAEKIIADFFEWKFV